MIKRIIISIIYFLLTEVISFLIQNFLTINTENVMIKTIIDNMIIIGTLIGLIIVCVLWIRWKYIDIINEIKYQRVKLKYYDMILAIYLNSSGTYSQYIPNETDLSFFSEKERVYLENHFKNISNIAIEIKGSNKEFGRF